MTLDGYFRRMEKVEAGMEIPLKKKGMTGMLDGYKDVLNIKEVCEILRIGRKTAYSLLKAGKLPYRKIGRCYKIPKAGLIRYLRDN